MMPRRKQARHTDVKDIRSILRLTFEQGLSIRAVSERLKMSKTSVSTYLLRAKEAGLAVYPLPPGLDEDDVLEHRLFGEWDGLHAIPSSRTGRRWPGN
jgi:DNA-binding transcriptional regulator LsrR (DeoR family)